MHCLVYYLVYRDMRKPIDSQAAGGLATCLLAASGREEGTNPEKIEAAHPSKRAIQILSLLHHLNRCFQLHLKRLSRDKARSACATEVHSLPQSIAATAGLLHTESLLVMHEFC